MQLKDCKREIIISQWHYINNEANLSFKMNVSPPLMMPHCYENGVHLPILVTLLSEELFDSRTLEMKLKTNLFLLFF